MRPCGFTRMSEPAAEANAECQSDSPRVDRVKQNAPVSRLSRSLKVRDQKSGSYFSRPLRGCLRLVQDSAPRGVTSREIERADRP